MSTRSTLHAARFLTVSFALIAAAGCTSVSPGPVAFEQKPWPAPDGSIGVQLITDHYDIRLTSRDETLRRYIAPFMETAFREYTALVPPALETDKRMVVYLFGSRDEWAQFTRVTFPAQAHTYLHIHAGGYVDHQSAVAVTHDIGRDHTLSLLAHEGLHQYMARYLPMTLPPWLNEGLATQFEYFRFPGSQPYPVFTPERNFLRKNSLREALRVQNGLIPVEKLLAMHAGQAVVKASQTTRAYYAQLWSLTLLLRRGADGKYADRLADLLADAGTRRLQQAIQAYRAATPDADKLSDGEVIFRQYITEDYAGFMTDYYDFAQQLIN